MNVYTTKDLRDAFGRASQGRVLSVLAEAGIAPIGVHSKNGAARATVRLWDSSAMSFLEKKYKEIQTAKKASLNLKLQKEADVKNSPNWTTTSLARITRRPTTDIVKRLRKYGIEPLWIETHGTITYTYWGTDAYDHCVTWRNALDAEMKPQQSGLGELVNTGLTLMEEESGTDYRANQSGVDIDAAHKEPSKYRSLHDKLDAIEATQKQLSEKVDRLCAAWGIV